MLLVKPDSMASRYLDVLRFLAALVVFVAHSTASERIPGYQAVMVFFVLSGYLIGSTVLRAIRENRWSWVTYLINRVTRLWIVLLPALLLTLFWSSLQQTMFGEFEVAGTDDWKTLLGNAFFLQKITVIVFGHNYPLWSLSYEFWYYILFPCLLLAIFSRRWTARIFYGLSFVGLALFLGNQIMSYFLIWLLGALISFVKPVYLRGYVKRIAFGSTITATIAAAFVSLNLYPVFDPPVRNIFYDIPVGLTSALLVYLILCHLNDFLFAKNRILDFFKYAAGFSFTLYLVHMPVINFLVASRTVDSSILNTPNALLKLFLKAAIFFGIFAYAWLISRITEENTDRVRKWLTTRTSKISVQLGVGTSRS
jgi:peptidoglycan/LPS O-acetylase OafA/YrhL